VDPRVELADRAFELGEVVVRHKLDDGHAQAKLSAAG